MYSERRILRKIPVDSISLHLQTERSSWLFDWFMTDARAHNRVLIVSFHDLSPHCRETCRQFLSEVQEIGIDRVSLLVAPRWHGGEAFTKDPSFVEWLRSLAESGHELCLHGYTHRAERVTGGPIARAMGRVYTASEGEFYQIDRTEARKRIEAGIELFQNAGLPMSGFTPPAWLLSAEGREVLREKGILYTTYLHRVENLVSGTQTYAPTLVFSSRSPWRRVVSLAWVRLWYLINRRTPVLRLAVHPNDLNYPPIRSTILQLATWAVQSRMPITYKELADRLADRAGFS